MTLKEAFKDCMRKLYPRGIHWGGEQHKALAQTFCMGYGEGVLKYGTKAQWAVLKWELVEVIPEDWYPDDTWRWA